MHIHFHDAPTGIDRFGKVYRFPGFMHVATYFRHGFLLPFTPLKSVVVLEDEQGDAASEHPIPLNWTSIWIAWGRGFVFYASAFVAVIGMAALTNSEWSVACALFGTIPFLLLLARLLLRIPGVAIASYDRASAVLESGKLPIQMHIELQYRFGRITASEAELMKRQATQDQTAGHLEALSRPQLRPKPSSEELEAIFDKPRKRWFRWGTK